MSEQGESTAVDEVIGPAPIERGWGKLLLAFVAFLIIPYFLQAFVPVVDTMLLFVPAMAACSLLGWWAGGRAYLAIAWVAIAALMLSGTSTPPDQFLSLVKGWSLLLAGSFGLVCLFGNHRPLFTRALVALTLALCLATSMSLLGPVTPSRAAGIVSGELNRRDALTSATMDSAMKAYPKEWADFAAKVPELGDFSERMKKTFAAMSEAGVTVFPALLALESLAALALAWSTYHRLGRARLGAPLKPIREFRFNDQLVWGLIVGLTIVLLPTLSTISAAGANLLVFFGALYVVRGFGVLSWFVAPGRLRNTMILGGVLLLAPVLNAFVFLGFVMLGITSLALGLGDTWADWRSRERPAAQ